MTNKRFSVEAMVHGYHVYKDVWEAVVREELHCKRHTKYCFLRCEIVDD